jgi:translocation and assembly module TamA
MPPSLRFFAGGDRSIRGYAWREVGPRIDGANAGNRYAIGAKQRGHRERRVRALLHPDRGARRSSSTPAARSTTRPTWHTGVGIGARWRSPVGPVRIDIARGLNSAGFAVPAATSASGADL